MNISFFKKTVLVVALVALLIPNVSHASALSDALAKIKSLTSQVVQLKNKLGAQAIDNTSGTPSITLISPNGGESFTEGQQVSVRWNASSFSENAEMGLDLQTVANEHMSLVMENTAHQYTFGNDGEETVLIPSIKQLTGATYGNNFKIRVYTIDPRTNAEIADVSDVSFSITSTTTETCTIKSFSADPLTVPMGGYSKLSWTTSGCSSVKVGDNPTLLSANGSVDVGPLSRTTRYAITATGQANTATLGTTGPLYPVTIQVAAVIDACTINSFTASPNPVSVGGRTTVSWKTTGCKYVYVNNSTAEANGSFTTGELRENVTYSIYAGNTLPAGCLSYYGKNQNTGAFCSNEAKGKTVTVVVKSPEVQTTQDLTPRIAYWYGKVNQHVDSTGAWQTDPNGTSGASVDKLTYCKKWYPNTISVEPYKNEFIGTWKAAGNTGNYSLEVMTDKCVQGTEKNTPYYISSIKGQKSEYSVNTPIDIIVQGKETADGSATTGINYEGFHVQAYIYKDIGNDESSLAASYLTPNPANSYNASFNSNTNSWNINMQSPSLPGDYILQMSLYCARSSGYYCGNKYMSPGHQDDKIIKFKVVDVSTVCDSATPYIKVLSPNGGEVYKAGQTIKVKWSSCNLSPKDAVTIQLENETENTSIGSLNIKNSLENLTGIGGTTANDGEDFATLPTSISVEGKKIYGYGKNFKLLLVVHKYENNNWNTIKNIGGRSDNLFTITDSNTLFPDGCTSESGYSVTTRQPCHMSEQFPAGCTSASGYSTTTGQPCSSNPSSLPAGCTSPHGFSATTGQPCGGGRGSDIHDDEVSEDEENGNRAFAFTRGLKLGLMGEDVKMLQMRLKEEGVFGGSPTGYFGPLTREGVRKLQIKNGLPALGLVGPKTLELLNK